MSSTLAFSGGVAEGVDPGLRHPEGDFKTLLRTVAARTVPDLWVAIRDAFTRFKPDECRNYLAAAGYDACDPT